MGKDMAADARIAQGFGHVLCSCAGGALREAGRQARRLCTACTCIPGLYILYVVVVRRVHKASSIACTSSAVYCGPRCGGGGGCDGGGGGGCDSSISPSSSFGSGGSGGRLSSAAVVCARRARPSPGPRSGQSSGCTCTHHTVIEQASMADDQGASSCVYVFVSTYT